MKESFIIYLKNKASSEFEYKSDVSNVVRTHKGYQITFNNGRSYNYGADKVRYYSYLSTRENVHIYENGKLNQQYNIVDNYGRYLIFRNVDSHSNPIENISNIEICDEKQDTVHAHSVIDYFKNILSHTGEISFEIQSDETESKNINQLSSDISLKALNRIDVGESRSALSNYLDGANPSICQSNETLIYPFGCNESQKMAVVSAFAKSISIVEGPPGTGKTQTILNILANLIVQNKTVAIVSNNNSAVSNIGEKLQKYGYDMIAASLGNNENIQAFFDNFKWRPIDKTWELQKDKLTEAKEIVKNIDIILTECFKHRNKLATLKTLLADTEIEFNHIQSEQQLSPIVKAELDKKFYRKWNYSKALKLSRTLSDIGNHKRLSIINKLRLILQYGLWDMSVLSHYNDELNPYLNHKFYELYINNLKDEISSTEKWLESNNEASNLKQFVETSKLLFDAALFDRYKNLKDGGFTGKDYKRHFDEFVKHFPVILSSTLSLSTCTQKNFLYDYLIIDESSQVDIIKAAVCFSCCRNVVVVGDSMQLSHIVDENSKGIAEELYKSYHIAPAYNYVKHHILSSLKTLYGAKINSVLLKEHYRCHPTIIGFCNKKYYDNNLVIMTSGTNHPFKIIETNISGARGKMNQRQIDETNIYIREHYSHDYTSVGVITPYRDHADMLKRILPIGSEADTIHKYQGREKNAIIFNTVSNQINDFIDNPNLINVAVSRAVKEFIIVKPQSMELPHGTNIGDLIRYIYYTTDPKKTIVKGKICSVFDLLYKEYNKAFVTFIESNNNIQGSAAEVIIYKLLTDEILLSNSQFSSIDMVREYKLRDLIRDYKPFTKDEIAFIKNNSRLDFLLYNKTDKTPVLAIEVDGISFHYNKVQQKRDTKKNHILDIIELPLLRLSTTGYNEKAKIIESLGNAMLISK